MKYGCCHSRRWARPLHKAHGAVRTGGRGERKMGERGTEARISPLIQINGKIFRLDADRLTVIWHPINLASLSPLPSPQHLLGFVPCLVLCVLSICCTCHALWCGLIDYEPNGDDDVLLDNWHSLLLYANWISCESPSSMCSVTWCDSAAPFTNSQQSVRKILITVTTALIMGSSFIWIVWQ